MKNNELHDQKITEGFTTPKDYFDTFEELILGKIETEAAIPKKEGFKVPDAYFDSLEDRLAGTLFATEKEEVKVISLSNRKQYLKYISYVTAACIVVAGIIMFGFGETNLSTNPTVTENEINTFIDNDLIAMNNYDLFAVYEEENIDISSIIEVNLDEKETFDYLENSVDPYDLLVE